MAGLEGGGNEEWLLEGKGFPWRDENILELVILVYSNTIKHTLGKYYFYDLWKSISSSVVSDPLWLHGLYPARLLCPWNSPGKNPGVGCHSLLQRIFPTQVSCIAGRFFTVWATRYVNYILVKNKNKNLLFRGQLRQYRLGLILDNIRE